MTAPRTSGAKSRRRPEPSGPAGRSSHSSAPTMRRTLTAQILSLALLAFAALLPAVTHAQPRLEASAAPNIVATGSAHYLFDTLKLDSADGERRYRVVIARPRTAAPAQGYPAVYLLDGNAAVEALNDTLLGELAATNPPVIVAIGYDTPQRFDVVARAYDYTPPLAGETPQADPLDPKRRNGGAADFLDFIEQRIKPEVAARVPVDATRQGLWGHSYGGLFVFYTLLTRPQAFAAYAAASPALWWRDGNLILGRDEDYARSLAGRHARLLVLRGDSEGRTTRPDAPPGATPERIAQRSRATGTLPPDALPALTARLGELPGVETAFQEFPGLDHGPMFPASIGPSLRWMSAPARP